MMKKHKELSQKLKRSVLLIVLILATLLSGPRLGVMGENPAKAQSNGPRTMFEPLFRTIDPATLPRFEAIPATTIPLFYPAQVSWEYLSQGAHPGAPAVRAGLSCRVCHDAGRIGPRFLGEKLINDPALEPTPIAGKRPWLDLKVKAAFDDEFIYWWFQWEAKEPGIIQDVLRYDAASGRWVSFGGPRPAGNPPLYEDRLTLHLGQPKGSPGYVTSQEGVPFGFQEHGCFLTCHNSMRDMPSGASDRLKFLLITQGKSSEELNALRASGKFLDQWMWRAHRSGPIGYGDDLWVFDSRRGDDGRGPFRDQTAANLNDPTFAATVFDPAKISSDNLNGGTFAISGGDDPLDVVKRQSTIPFLTMHGELFTSDGMSVQGFSRPLANSGYMPQNNDLLYRRRLQTPQGSRSELLAHATFVRPPDAEMGTWTLIIKRRLNTGNSLDDHALERGRIYPVGFAVHDDAVESRFHHVSLEYLLGLGRDVRGVDINAYHVSEIR